MTFRIFTNDGSHIGGIPKYSRLCEVEADTPQEAVKSVELNHASPHRAPLKAIEWPPQTRASRNWLVTYT